MSLFEQFVSVLFVLSAQSEQWVCVCGSALKLNPLSILLSAVQLGTMSRSPLRSFRQHHSNHHRCNVASHPVLRHGLSAATGKQQSAPHAPPGAGSSGSSPDASVGALASMAATPVSASVAAGSAAASGAAPAFDASGTAASASTPSAAASGSPAAATPAVAATCMVVRLCATMAASCEGSSTSHVWSTCRAQEAKGSGWIDRSCRPDPEHAVLEAAFLTWPAVTWSSGRVQLSKVSPEGCSASCVGRASRCLRIRHSH